MLNKADYRDSTPIGVKEKELDEAQVGNLTKKYTKAIREKQFGVDVREGISRGIESVAYETDKRVITLTDEKGEKNKKEIMDSLAEVNSSAEVLAARKSEHYGSHTSLGRRLDTAEKQTIAKFQSPRITKENGDPVFEWTAGTVQEQIRNITPGLSAVNAGPNVVGLPSKHNYKIMLYKKNISGTTYGEGWVKAFCFLTNKEYTRYFERNILTDWEEMVSKKTLDIAVDNAKEKWEVIFDEIKVLTTPINFTQKFNVEKEIKKIRVTFAFMGVFEFQEFERSQYEGKPQFDISSPNINNQRRACAVRFDGNNINFHAVTGSLSLTKMEVIRK